jgi:hypothetical protein
MRMFGAIRSWRSAATILAACSLLSPLLTHAADQSSHRTRAVNHHASSAADLQVNQRTRRLEAFQADRMQLMEEEMAVRQSARGKDPQAREQAMVAWRETQQARRDALRAEAQALAASQPRVELPFIEEIILPPGATPELEALLLARAELQNDWRELQNHLLTAAPAAREQAEAAYRVRSENHRQILAGLSNQLAKQLAGRPQPPLPEPIVPADATPALTAFFKARHRRMVEERAFSEKIRHLPELAQIEARAQWEKAQAPARAESVGKVKKLAEEAR